MLNTQFFNFAVRSYWSTFNALVQQSQIIVIYNKFSMFNVHKKIWRFVCKN